MRTHTYTHTLTLTHTYTYTHTLTLTHTYTHTHTYKHTHTHTQIQTHTRTSMLTRKHKRACTDLQTNTLTHLPAASLASQTCEWHMPTHVQALLEHTHFGHATNRSLCVCLDCYGNICIAPSTEMASVDRQPLLATFNRWV